MHACVLSRFSCLQLCTTLGTAACQASLSMGFSRQEYWSALPWPPPGDLTLEVRSYPYLNPGIETASHVYFHRQVGCLPLAPPWMPEIKDTKREMLEIFSQVYSKGTRVNEITRGPLIIHNLTATLTKYNRFFFIEEWEHRGGTQQVGSKGHSFHSATENKQCLKAGLEGEDPEFVRRHHQTESRKGAKIKET